jgi:hypothetical protein
MFVALSLLLAAACGVPALGKLTAQPKMLASASHFAIPWSSYRLIVSAVPRTATHRRRRPTRADVRRLAAGSCERDVGCAVKETTQPGRDSSRLRGVTFGSRPVFRIARERVSPLGWKH